MHLWPLPSFEVSHHLSAFPQLIESPFPTEEDFVMIGKVLCICMPFRVKWEVTCGHGAARLCDLPGTVPIRTHRWALD